MSAELDSIQHPNRLRAGAVLLRRWKAGEVIAAEWWVVTEWVTPPRPRPGESWGSGFLKCRNRDNPQIVQQFGPAALIRQDFLQLVERREVATSQAKTPTRKLHWWERD